MIDSIEIHISHGEYNHYDALFLSFEMANQCILRTTKEYNLTYIPALCEWHGDVIAYGGWFDLEDAELIQLRKQFNLDVVVFFYTNN